MLYRKQAIQQGYCDTRASKPNHIKITGEQFSSVVAVDTENYRRFYERGVA